MSHAVPSASHYARPVASTSSSSLPYRQSVEHDDELLETREPSTRAASPPPYSDTTLLNTLAPSPSSSESPPHQAIRSRPRSPPERTVSMLKDKSCWICMGEANEDDPADRRKWVHACNCTLVAHEDVSRVSLRSPKLRHADACIPTVPPRLVSHRFRYSTHTLLPRLHSSHHHYPVLLAASHLLQALGSAMGQGRYSARHRRSARRRMARCGSVWCLCRSSVGGRRGRSGFAVGSAGRGHEAVEVLA